MTIQYCYSAEKYLTCRIILFNISCLWFNPPPQKNQKNKQTNQKRNRIVSKTEDGQR